MTANPADAVREAPTELDRIIAEMRNFSDAHVIASRARVSAWADRLAALAGAGPVAWSRTETINDDSGCPIGLDEPRIVWQAECPDPEDGGWHPLYDRAHAPAKAREATDDVGDGMRYRVLRAANITWNGRRWPDPIELDQATSAALATFAEDRPSDAG